jgi:hypothetical protein
MKPMNKSRKPRPLGNKINKLAIALNKASIVKSKIKKKRIVKDKYKEVQKHAYLKLLAEPFLSQSCRLPLYYMGDTHIFKRTLNYSFALTANTNTFIHIQPDRIIDKTGVATPLLVDNTPTYNPSTGQTIGVNGVSVVPVLNLDIANINNLRIVACGVKIWVTDSALNLKGTMYAAVFQDFCSSVNDNAATIIPQNLYLQSYIIKHPQHVELTLNPDICVEYRRLVADETLFASSPIQSYAGAKLASTCSQLAAVIVGASTTSTVNIQMIYHFEATVDPNGQLADENLQRTSCLIHPFEANTYLAQTKMKELRVNKLSLAYAHAHANVIRLSNTKVLKDVDLEQMFADPVFTPHKGETVQQHFFEQ